MSWANEEFGEIDENKIKDNPKKEPVAEIPKAEIPKTEIPKTEIPKTEIPKAADNVIVDKKSEIDLSALDMQNKNTEPKRISKYNPEYYKLHKDKFLISNAKYRQKQKLLREKAKTSANPQNPSL